MRLLTTLLIGLTAITSSAVALPHFGVPLEHLEILRMRADMEVNPDAVYDMECINPRTNIVFHDSNKAQLAICGGIAGAVSGCRGSPVETTGQAGTAKFVLTPRTEGATVEISKERWEQCVRAARAVCPTGSMKGVCRGGGSRGDVGFMLTRP